MKKIVGTFIFLLCCCSICFAWTPKTTNSCNPLKGKVDDCTSQQMEERVTWYNSEEWKTYKEKQEKELEKRVQQWQIIASSYDVDNGTINLSNILDTLTGSFQNCFNNIDSSIFGDHCDITIISWYLNEVSQCLTSIDTDIEYKSTRDLCISLLEDGDDGVKTLQKKYDQLYSWLIAEEAAFREWTSTYQNNPELYSSTTKEKIRLLETTNKQIDQKKAWIQQCKQKYNDIQDIQKDIKNTIGNIEKQQKSLTKAENKNQKKKDKNSNQEANSLRDTSKSVEKAENKRKEKDEKADYALNQACLSARDFLYTLKYGTTMKKGNPWNDLIENRSPREMLDKVVYDANAIDQYQETAMDGVTSRDESCVNGWGRITNTLCWVKNHIHPYIQWIVYLGLTLSVILLIYNGFKMVTNVMHGEGDFWKIKTNILYIGLWIIILTGFYYLLDIVMAIINFLFD